MSWKNIIKEKLSDDDLREQYEEMLDEVYGEVKFGNLTFSPSSIIRELDETAYRIGLSEYEDSLLEDEDYE
tara:strand:- start:36 stop:248 length:213 start_codon:yes stop_codon:yes gene_type:complete